MDAIQRFTGNVVRTTYDMLPASALAATKTFILDTLGVSVPVGVHVRLQNEGVWQIVLSFGTLWGKRSDHRLWSIQTFP